MNKQLDTIGAQLASVNIQGDTQLPPVHLWNPPLSGDMDLEIKTNGHWVHEGQVIQRHALVRLFCRILKREQDDYFLVTPVEKWRIKVESYPLFFDNLDISQGPQGQEIHLSGHCGQTVTVGQDNPLWVEQTSRGPLPVVVARGPLNGVLSRNVYYQLADVAEPVGEELWVSSRGARFSLAEQPPASI